MVASLLGQNERKIDLRIKFVMKRKVELSILKDLGKKKRKGKNLQECGQAGFAGDGKDTSHG